MKRRITLSTAQIADVLLAGGSGAIWTSKDKSVSVKIDGATHRALKEIRPRLEDVTQQIDLALADFIAFMVKLAMNDDRSGKGTSARAYRRLLRAADPVRSSYTQSDSGFREQCRQFVDTVEKTLLARRALPEDLQFEDQLIHFAATGAVEHLNRRLRRLRLTWVPENEVGEIIWIAAQAVEEVLREFGEPVNLSSKSAKKALADAAWRNLAESKELPDVEPSDYAKWPIRERRPGLPTLKRIQNLLSPSDKHAVWASVLVVFLSNHKQLL